MPTPARRTWTAIVRLLERDERVFAFLLAVVMVGGLATLGLALRPRYRVDLPSLVFWFAMYKVGILALVSVNPSARKTRVVFSGALAVDLLLVFALLRRLAAQPAQAGAQRLAGYGVGVLASYWMFARLFA